MLLYRFAITVFSFLLAGVAFSPSFVSAQTPTEQDCLGAIPICDFIWSTGSSTLGSGNYLNEIGPGTCLTAGELNSTWFTFTVIESGDLAFTITPIDLNADYDWGLYNLTNASCEDIPTDGSLMASCNSSQYGVTGISSSGIGNYNGPGPTFAFNYLLPVVSGQTYALNIHNWSTSNGGYSIDFSTATATIFDTVPPSLQVVTPIGCNSTSLSFTFSENILCNTVEVADFSLEGPGGAVYGEIIVRSNRFHWRCLLPMPRARAPVARQSVWASDSEPADPLPSEHRRRTLTATTHRA